MQAGWQDVNKISAALSSMFFLPVSRLRRSIKLNHQTCNAMQRLLDGPSINIAFEQLLFYNGVPLGSNAVV
jgi:hypothetical protein